MISTQLLKEHPFETYSMTEDIEYSSIVISRYKEKIMWVPDAVTYDEQPLLFSESVTQRRRWTVGTVQCFKRYARTLLKNTFKDKNMSCLDMFVLLQRAIYADCGPCAGIDDSGGVYPHDGFEYCRAVFAAVLGRIDFKHAGMLCRDDDCSLSCAQAGT